MYRLLISFLKSLPPESSGSAFFRGVIQIRFSDRAGFTRDKVSEKPAAKQL